jgi:hypothetical protein
MGLFNLVYHDDEEGEGIDPGKEITSPQFYPPTQKTTGSARG